MDVTIEEQRPFGRVGAAIGFLIQTGRLSGSSSGPELVDGSLEEEAIGGIPVCLARSPWVWGRESNEDKGSDHNNGQTHLGCGMGIVNCKTTAFVVWIAGGLDCQ